MVNHTLPSSNPKAASKRAVIWKAVSSQRQAGDDKVSLEEQERLAREWCDKHGFEVVTVLSVPGHSRRESDIVEALKEFRRKGIYAYDDLKLMWDNDDFDVLVAYTHDRLGRSQTLHSYVVENVIRNGKRIFFLADGGFVDESNYRFSNAMGGVLAASPVDRLVKAAKVAKDKLIKEGLPTGPHLPLSHKLIRDPETGKAVEVVLDESKFQLFRDLATIFLEGTAYNLLSQELYERFGHANPDGTPYYANAFYYLLFTPVFWGHMARGYTHASKNGDLRGAWIFDETIPPPDGVKVARNVVPAVYVDDLADSMKAELHRRMDVTGRRKANDTYRFAGLFECGECGSSMSTRSKPGYGRVGVRCSTIHNRTSNKECNQRYLTPHRYLQASMEKLLEQLVIGADPELFTKTDDHTIEQEKQLNALKNEKDDLQKNIHFLIEEQMNAPDSARQFYRQQIEAKSSRLEQLNKQIQVLHFAIEEEQYTSREETRTIEELRKLTLECFWNLPDREINQWLRRLIGKRKFVIIDREITGVIEKV